MRASQFMQACYVHDKRLKRPLASTGIQATHNDWSDDTMVTSAEQSTGAAGRT
jgi:hypothetical protein